MSNITRCDRPSKVRQYFSTPRVARYVASSGIAGAVTWLAIANSGLGVLIPGGLGPWIPAALVSGLIAFGLAPFVILDPKNVQDRVVRSALALGVGHLFFAVLWSVLFPANLLLGFVWAVGQAAVGALAGALAGLISWKRE